jgi:hypothetical protein
VTQEERNGQARFGKVLSAVGSVWILLFFVGNFFDVGGTALGDILAFFGNTGFFVPIALLFAGRAVQRRSAQTPTQTTVPERPRPTQRQASKPRPVPKPDTIPEKKTVEMPAASQPDVDELAAAIGFGEASADSESDRPGDANEDQFKPRYEPSYKAKTSDEMIAEARKRLEKER